MVSHLADSWTLGLVPRYSGPVVGCIPFPKRRQPVAYVRRGRLAAGGTEPVHELWEEHDGRTMVCFAGPAGDAARASLEPGARLSWVFEASSHFDAMTRYHDRMEWAPYNSPQPLDLEPYPSEWIVEQRAALAAELGNRDVIAAGASARAWREAAADLGIRFESPFAMSHGVRRIGALAGCLTLGVPRARSSPAGTPSTLSLMPVKPLVSIPPD